MLTTNMRLERRTVVVFIVVVVAATLVIIWVRRVQSRQALEPIREKYRARQALVRYIQLRHQSSEEAAYRRLSAFVKGRVPPDQQASIDYMAIYDRQRLLELAQRLLMHDPDEIDKI